MTYCPLCVPEIGITDNDYVIVRYFPKSEMDMETMQTRTFELDTGIHIIREGWFKESPERNEDYLVTWEICHPLNDWNIKHMLSSDEIKIESDIINQTLSDL